MALTCRRHVMLLSLPDKVGISIEVKLLLHVILYCCERTLTNTLTTLVLCLGDLLLDTVGVVVVDLF